MNFKQFFENYHDIANLKMASNPRHRTGGAITNPSRKHQNIVADSQRKSNEYKSYDITKAKYNKGRTKLSEIQAEEVAKKYGLNLLNKDKTKNFSLALKQRDSQGVGRYLEYDPKFGYSIQIKKI
jgi:hypothetical protein